MAWAVAFIVLTVVLATARLSPVPPPDQRVSEAQRLLLEQQLYVGGVNGRYDRPTRAAIRRFQMLHNLRVTGELNGETIGKMALPAEVEPAIAEADRRALEELPSQPPQAVSPPAIGEAPETPEPASESP